MLMALLGMSLDNEAGFADALALLDNGFVAFIVWGVLAALAYHFVAGVKHLFMDMGYGETLGWSIFANSDGGRSIDGVMGVGVVTNVLNYGRSGVADWVVQRFSALIRPPIQL